MRQASRKRVVMTGLGMITPLGLDAGATWAALLEGRSGVGPITRFDPEGYACRIAAEVKGFDPGNFLERKVLRRMDTFSQYAIGAAQEALNDAHLRINADNADRVGVYIGSGIGGLPTLERQHKELLERGPRRLSPFTIPAMILNLAAGNVAIHLGARGPNLALATACATGTHAIGESARLIRDGYCDAMIAGGSEAAITPLAIGAFCAMKALTTRNDEPQLASRPFDALRDGFIMGEGAGIVVLEERDQAIARGANIYAEVSGYGMSGDAYHISAPSVDGNGAARAMKIALDDAGADPSTIDYINAHATSTPAGDRVETMAVKTVFGDHASKLVFGSTKSMTGHLLGAAGGIETAIAALAIREQRVPPTVNQTEPDPECDLDCAPNESRQMTVDSVLNNSFGFGGTNASLVLSRHH